VRFFYLNRNCFNGIYRTNKAGQFNVPYGRKTGRLPALENWISASRALAGVTLESRDFEAVVRKHTGEGDFVYLDPPYAVANRRVFKQYAATEFGLQDLERLRSLMTHIDSVGATFVVSYAQSQETAILAHGWHSFRQLAQRNIAGFSHQRRKAVEVIISNDLGRVPRRGSPVSVVL
jgi:DNA adenine methylase